jgi:phosphoribosyl 1,2-cyclic phosphodiesterase
MFKVKFWGVRGSIPVPGASTVRFGGNTSCVEVRCGSSLLVFDGGTGLRLLGEHMHATARDAPESVHLFFSHLHWDHIQGFPFFRPAYDPHRALHLYGGANRVITVRTALSRQMDRGNFPVRLEDLPCSLQFRAVRQGQLLELENGIRVYVMRGFHPGGVYLYRVEYKGRSLVYATDTEPHPATDRHLVRFSKDARLWIYDSMYTPEEYAGSLDGFDRDDTGPSTSSKKGWGHSTFEVGAKLARAARVGHYVLFHHAPEHTDRDIRSKEQRAQALFPNSLAAYEGLELEL